MQELNQQLAEAQGFSGVKTLMAEAYQMSLGRTGDQIKPLTEALKELKDAMQKGKVATDKVFPYFEQLLRRESARGLDIARVSAQSEQGRFSTQIDIGWQNFTKGGGEAGLSYFWRMMQKMGSWWEENGFSLGQQFEGLMLWVNVFRLAIRDLFNFIVSGEDNDLVSIINQWGIDIQAIRDEIVKIFQNLSNAFTGSTEKSLGEIIQIKLQNFSDTLIKILANVNEFLVGLTMLMDAAKIYKTGSFSEKFGALPMGVEGLSKMTSAVVKGTWNAGEASVDLLTNTTAKRDKELSYVDANGMMRRRIGVAQAPGEIDRNAPVRYNLGDSQSLPSTSPIAALQTPTRPDSKQTVDVNVTVSGNPELVKMYDPAEMKTQMTGIVYDAFGTIMTGSSTSASKF